MRLETLWEGAEEIVVSTFKNERTAAQAGHAMSKDWTAGFLILQWLLTYFGNSKVIVTGPTDRQVKEIVFNELEKQYLRFLQMYPAQGFRKDYLSTNKLDFGPECFALGFTTKEVNEQVGKFHGFHSPNLLIIVTEAQAVSPATFKQIRGLITSKNSRILELGNPLVEFGDFYEHCTNTRHGYHVIHLPCDRSPNVVAGSEVIPGMATKEYIDRMRQDCGPDYDDDSEYQGRVLAMFPQQSRNAWIPLAKIKAAVGRPTPANDDDIKVGGLDTAREGDDETVHCVLKGRRQVKQDCFRKVLTPETVGWARELIESEKLEALGVDEGYNPGILDWLSFDHMPVVGINFGAESPHEKFENFGTYMWWLVREAFMNGEPSILADPILVSQLASRKVEMTPRGKKRLVSKKRQGTVSPDRADAFVIAWYMRVTTASGGSFVAGPESDAAKLEGILARIAPRPVMPTVPSVRIAESEEESHGHISPGTPMDAESLRF